MKFSRQQNSSVSTPISLLRGWTVIAWRQSTRHFLVAYEYFCCLGKVLQPVYIHVDLLVGNCTSKDFFDPRESQRTLSLKVKPPVLDCGGNGGLVFSQAYTFERSDQVCRILELSLMGVYTLKTLFMVCRRRSLQATPLGNSWDWVWRGWAGSWTLP